MDLEEYIRIGEPSQRERAEAWQLAIGLQAVDQLHVSSYLLQTASEHVEGTISQDEVEQRITAYYQTEESRLEEAGTDEADQVSARIVKVLASRNFTFSPSHYASIHRQLFTGILPHAGRHFAHHGIPGTILPQHPIRRAQRTQKPLFAYRLEGRT